MSTCTKVRHPDRPGVALRLEIPRVLQGASPPSEGAIGWGLIHEYYRDAA
jgi:hypothetical protein